MTTKLSRRDAEKLQDALPAIPLIARHPVLYPVRNADGTIAPNTKHSIQRYQIAPLQFAAAWLRGTGHAQEAAAIESMLTLIRHADRGGHWIEIERAQLDGTRLETAHRLVGTAVDRQVHPASPYGPEDEED